VSGDLAYGLFFLVVGSFFAIHCTRATLSEFRSGVALGHHYSMVRRSRSPIAFWLIIVGNGLAAFMGLGFLTLGIVSLYWLFV
jgi:hypothetical protein